MERKMTGRYDVEKEPENPSSRRTIYLSSEADKVVSRLPKKRRSSFVSDLVLQSVDPPYKFYPQDDGLYSEEFLAGTRHSLSVAGITLRRLVRPHRATLESLISRGVTIRAAVLDPDLTPDKPV